ncbi:MAG: serine/threonine-protein phosphatase, partial [Actinobacteria bacterium]|nr:serine/threonine-protein phosphatase [Actinomycetota bacterium]
MAKDSVLSAASSHIGKIRLTNQDSGSVGRHLFVVADGMGGHAGGDVASALAVQHLSRLDRAYSSVDEARETLFTNILEAGRELTSTVEEHPELTGMGTTVSAMIRVGSQMVIAHIGDSRIYRLREGVLEQITSDHTFVQRLVDSGRITPEEAAVHPRRSVLMRVLGDVDAEPEVDTHVVDTQPGDRWLLCSDGLSGYVPERDIAETLLTIDDVELACHKLITQTLSEGAPDNVTVV